MSATLTISTSGADFVVPLYSGTNPIYTLEPDFSFGSIAWRRVTAQSPTVAGRVGTGAVRDTPMVTGGIRCYGYGANAELDLQTRIADVIAVLTQQSATWTYTHGDGASPAIYQWKCTEPGDCSLGQGDVIQDMEMANLMQAVRFTVPRDPSPLQGPI